MLLCSQPTFWEPHEADTTMPPCILLPRKPTLLGPGLCTASWWSHWQVAPWRPERRPGAAPGAPGSALGGVLGAPQHRLGVSRWLGSPGRPVAWGRGSFSARRGAAVQLRPRVHLSPVGPRIPSPAHDNVRLRSAVCDERRRSSLGGVEIIVR